MSKTSKSRIKDSKVQNFFEVLSYIEIRVIGDIGYLKHEFDIPSAGPNLLFLYNSSDSENHKKHSFSYEF